MEDKHQKLIHSGMGFTADMTTSVTHELKNKLAIVNENAGIIQDFFYLEKQGRPMDMSRIEAITHKIQDQIRAADAIIKKLNRFAHTMAVLEEEVDLEQTLQVLLELTDHLTVKGKCEITIMPPKRSVMVTTNSFYLQNLLWEAIKTACAPENASKSIRISFEGDNDTLPGLLFFCEKTQDMDSDDIPGLMKTLADYLRIRVRVLEEKNGFGLFWLKSKE